MREQVIIALVDAVASTVLLLAGRYVSPADVDTLKTLVVLWQPIVIALLVSVAYQQNLIIKVQGGK